MKATATRTLQAPQYAPITMTLEEECTPETFTATLNKLADLIENTLRERYPQYAGVLPQVSKKPVAPVIKSSGTSTAMPVKVFTDKVIHRYSGAALIECINKCIYPYQLRQYESQLDSDAAEVAYNNKMAELMDTPELVPNT